MSQRLHQNQPFLELLLSTHDIQKRALLDTLSPQQVNLISELIYNILYTVPIQNQERKTLQRRKYFKEIAKIKRSIQHRKKLIKKHKKELFKVLARYRANIVSLL